MPSAPTAAVDPEIATERPKSPPAAPPAAVSLACWVQVLPECVNVYAAPAPEPVKAGAPITAVDPATATELPKSSLAAPSAAVSSACWDQVLPERVNTYAAPVAELVPSAPTTTVDPAIATEPPNSSNAAPSVSSACWDQVVPERVNTYTVPMPGSLPSAPTTTVDPEIATAAPNRPPAAVSVACGDQVPPEPTNTYAAPTCELVPSAPTTTVDPEIATAAPKKSSAVAPGSASSACWVQVAPERAKTYAAPANESVPSAPTTTVDPAMATE